MNDLVIKIGDEEEAIGNYYNPENRIIYLIVDVSKSLVGLHHEIMHRILHDIDSEELSRMWDNIAYGVESFLFSDDIMFID